MQELSDARTEQRQELQRQAADKDKSLDEARSEVRELQEQLTQAHLDMRAHQQRKVDEMDRVENRVKAAIQRKDETIAALRGQVEELQQHMRSAEDMLSIDH
jgi:polyhydroxyalkanoate synthesis regulator phasin